MTLPLKPYIRLRGHHLICLHFFSGEGYDSEFIANLRSIFKKIGSGEEIVICTDADDVCRKCPHLNRERCLFDKNSDYEIKEMDSRALQLLRLSANGKVKWMEVRDRIPEIIREWEDTYCKFCNWKKTCEGMFPDL